MKTYCKTNVKSLDLSIRNGVESPTAGYHLQYAMPFRVLKADRNDFNESKSREMEACIVDDAGKILCFIPNPASMKIAPLLSAAPDLLTALKRAIDYIEEMPHPQNYVAKDLAAVVARAEGKQ